MLRAPTDVNRGPSDLIEPANALVFLIIAFAGIAYRHSVPLFAVNTLAGIAVALYLRSWGRSADRVQTMSRYLPTPSTALFYLSLTFAFVILLVSLVYQQKLPVGFLGRSPRWAFLTSVDEGILQVIAVFLLSSVGSLYLRRTKQTPSRWSLPFLSIGLLTVFVTVLSAETALSSNGVAEPGVLAHAFGITACSAWGFAIRQTFLALFFLAMVAQPTWDDAFFKHSRSLFCFLVLGLSALGLLLRWNRLGGDAVGFGVGIALGCLVFWALALLIVAVSESRTDFLRKRVFAIALWAAGCVPLFLSVDSGSIPQWWPALVIAISGEIAFLRGWWTTAPEHVSLGIRSNHAVSPGGTNERVATPVSGRYFPRVHINQLLLVVGISLAAGLAGRVTPHLLATIGFDWTGPQAATIRLLMTGISAGLLAALFNPFGRSQTKDS